MGDFESYLRAKRLEQRLTPRLFWADYLAMLGWCVALVAVATAAARLAPSAFTLIGAL